MSKDRLDDLNIEINFGSAIVLYVNSKVKNIVPTVKTWGSRIKTRSELKKSLHNMDISIIEKDIGLAPGTLENEAHKPFWKA